MAEPLNWDTDGRDWPHRAASRFVQAAGMRWHVQHMGRGPGLLLLHGTGASTHSWRDLAPLLAQRFEVTSLDLPGHAFSDTPQHWQLTLPGMARAVGDLVAALDAAPAVVVGHSAGAAIAARMCLDGHVEPRLLVSLNGAILPLGGFAGQLFSPVAKLMAVTSLVPRLFAWRAEDRAVVQKLIDGTGSTLDARGVELYARLVRNPVHAAGALAMMANWDLEPLQQALPALKPQLRLVVGDNDRTIPPAQSHRLLAMLPTATLTALPRLGHLAHEEQPQQMAELIERAAQAVGVFG